MWKVEVTDWKGFIKLPYETKNGNNIHHNSGLVYILALYDFPWQLETGRIKRTVGKFLCIRYLKLLNKIQILKINIKSKLFLIFETRKVSVSECVNFKTLLLL